MRYYFLLFLINSFSAMAFTLAPADSSSVSIVVPYTMGEHKLQANGFKGGIEWDSKTNEIKKGQLQLSIMNIQSDKDKLECHLRESMGLDYMASEFPKKHVCDDDNKLPIGGPNSIKYPEIIGTLLAPLKLGENEARVNWMIHGKSKEMVMPITVSSDKTSGHISLKSNWKMKLSDFDIIVKKFLFIGVKDDVSLNLTMSFAQK